MAAGFNTQPSKQPDGLAFELNGLRLGFLLLLLTGAFFLHVRIRQGNERKKLISALRYRERMLAQVGRIVSVGGFEYEIDKGFVYWSREVLKILDLIDAIEHNQLKVFYQPILDLKSGDVYEVEALLRWQNPEQGFIPPDKLIPLTEDVGLISQFGEISMKTAIEDILEVNKDFGLSIGLSLNRSYREFFGSVEDGDEL